MEENITRRKSEVQHTDALLFRNTRDAEYVYNRVSVFPCGVIVFRLNQFDGYFKPVPNDMCLFIVSYLADKMFLARSSAADFESV